VSAGAHRARVRLSAVPSPPESGSSYADDMKIARRRMRHLAPWNVEPVPVMHAATGRPADPLNASVRERGRRLAVQVLAIHIWHAAARSALQ
jgi:hypothetical protein